MYHAHWGLQTSPFGNEAAASPAPASAGFDEALARLQYLLEQRGRAGLLLGSSGTGKTTLLRRFCDVSRRHGLAAALVGGKGASESSFLQQLSRGWQLPPVNDRELCWEQFADRLVELRFEQTAAVVALDDADQTPAAIRCQFERLQHLADQAQTQLTIVLASELETAGSIGAALLDQIELRIDLTPWTEEETAEHVALRLLHSGSELPIFTDEAIAALHELSGGIPRKVDQIAQLALLAGAGQQLVEIDAVTLTEAYQELGPGGL
ncbi:ExeA family protein [Anatilimnocola floriformis]|uniref:ExeA family protein n=1 Tax=Anatilimnocola floriformis TaxID=2948575 RepID=UPI0020C534D1|nr:AAA family ATPase [Anatilimnocola floriformis]